MGVFYSRQKTEFDEEEWKRLAPPEIPLAQEFIERQEVKEKINEANEKMKRWDQPVKELKVQFNDNVDYQEALPTPRVDSPGVVECDCGRCWH